MKVRMMVTSVNILVILCTWTGYSIDAVPSVRLVGSNNTWEGRVEVLIQNQWGTVCDDDWGIKDAGVVCRELGYTGALYAYCCSNFGEGEGPILMDDVKCIGNETSISQCPNKGRGIHNCAHFEDAGVACIHPFKFEEGNFTLGSCDFEIVHGLCGYTNDQSNDDYDWVLGSGRSYHYFWRWPSTGPSGDHTNGSHGFYLYIDTSTELVAQGQSARLVSPTLSNGSCLQFYYHMWGKTIGELNVYLQEVGSTSEIVWTLMGTQGDKWRLGVVPLSRKRSKFNIIFEGVAGTGLTGDIGLDDVSVSNADCKILPTNAVPKPVGNVTKAVRLRSKIASAGRLEVFHVGRGGKAGRWGTVCGDGFDINDADVVCKELKYEGAEMVVPCCHSFGGGSGPIWLDSLRCQGREPSIFMCPHRGWGVTRCSHDDDVGIICKTKETNMSDFRVRLKGSPLPYKGRIEIEIGDIWGSVDDSGWDIYDSTVVCRQLGFAGAVGAYSGGVFGSGSGPVWISGVECEGYEKSLSRCKHERLQTFNNTHDDRRDASVECYDLRLQGGKDKSSGRVEVQYEGEWGTVCDHGWNHKAADVICRQLGFLRAQSHECCAAFGQGRGPILMDQVTCQGNEPSIAFCRHSGWRAHACSHSNDAGVVCTNKTAPPGFTTASPHGHGSTVFCNQHSCMNGGFCPWDEDGAICVCPDNYTGDSCEVDIGINTVEVILDTKSSELGMDDFKEALVIQLNEFCEIDNCGKTPRNNSSSKETSPSRDFHKPDVVILRNYPKHFANAVLLKMAVYFAHNSNKEVLSRDVLTKLIYESDNILAGYEVIMYSGSNHKPQPQAHVDKESKGNKYVIIGVTVPLSIIIILGLFFALARCRRNSRRTRFPANYSDQSYMALHADEDNQHDPDDDPLLRVSEESDNPVA